MRKALELGVNINLDNDHEMEIVDRLMRNEYKGGTAKSKHIGLRINPLVGDVTDGNLKEIDEAYHIADMAIKESKFGIPLNTDTKDKVMALFKKYEWLNSLHCHAGSHGTPMKFFIGAARVRKLILEYYSSESFQSFDLYSIASGRLCPRSGAELSEEA